MNFAECNITELLRETYLRFTSLAKQKGLDFKLQLPEGDLLAHVNKEALTKIISNLLNNAVKYSESYVQISLEVDQRAEKNVFRIRTVNDGAIIPDAMKEKIFQPFVRFTEEGERQVATGTGIGLALSRSLAEFHQGTLQMDKGELTNSFCLTLPMIQDSAITLAHETMSVNADKVVEQQRGVLDNNKSNQATILVVCRHLLLASYQGIIPF